MEEKDFSLLRPFNEEAAKAGAECCWSHDGLKLRYVGECTSISNVGCFQWLEGDNKGTFETYLERDIRMAPLAWVEGRPVYPGDVLYLAQNSGNPGLKFTAGTKIIHGEIIQGVSERPNGLKFGVNEESGLYPRNLTWTPPKVKREGWANVYQNHEGMMDVHSAFVTHAFATEELAEKYRGNHDMPFIACIRIEWEEPAGADIEPQWIEWNGGACPVPDGTFVDVKYRDGEVKTNLPANVTRPGLDAAYAFWENDGNICDIVAYRLTK